MYQKVKVYFDSNHDEYFDPASADSDRGYSTFKSVLESMKCKWGEVQVEKKTETITSSALSGYRALIIAAPALSFASDEIDAIVNFVRSGAGLLLIGEGLEADLYAYTIVDEVLNSIAKKFGVTFMDNFPANYAITYEPTHAIMTTPKRVRSCIGNIPGSCIFPAGTPIIDLSDAYGYGTDLAILERVEGIGRVVCLGNGSYFNEASIDKSDNRQLARNIIRWLTESRVLVEVFPDEAILNIAPTNSASVPFTIKVRGNINVNYTLFSIYGDIADWGSSNVYFDTSGNQTKTFSDMAPGDKQKTTLNITVPSGTASGVHDGVVIVQADANYLYIPITVVV